jgi:outer membrane protein
MTFRRGLLAALTCIPLVGGLALAEDAPLELSLDQAVERALENNTDIAIQRFNPESSAESVREARGVYDPTFTSTLTRQSAQSPQSNVFSSKSDKTTVFNFGLQQYAPTGATLSVDFNNRKQDTTNPLASFNPSYGSSLTLQLSQPLLRNLKTDSQRYQLRVAKRNKEISDVQFHQSVVNTVAAVKSRYYDLIYYIDNLSVQNKSLALAQKLLDENQIKVKVGTMAPLDVVSAEAEVARIKNIVIAAQTSLAQAEDNLKLLIFPKNDLAMWALHIDPTDRPTAERTDIDVDAAIKKALEQRTDVVAQRKTLEIAEERLRLARNGRLPGVDLILSYVTTGQGGTQLVRDPNNPLGPVVNEIPGGYGDAASQVFGRDFPTWMAGVNVTIPIPNRSARASMARAHIALDQTKAQLTALELQVTSQVRTAGRAVESGYQQVESTKAARVLAERRLDAEQKRFAAGMSTNFMVTQAQRDLAQAEADELQAVADYRKSIISFEQVQEAGTGGITFAGSGS